VKDPVQKGAYKHALFFNNHFGGLSSPKRPFLLACVERSWTKVRELKRGSSSEGGKARELK